MSALGDVEFRDVVHGQAVSAECRDLVRGIVDTEHAMLGWLRLEVVLAVEPSGRAEVVDLTVRNSAGGFVVLSEADRRSYAGWFVDAYQRGIGRGGVHKG